MDRLYGLLEHLGYTHPLHPPWTYIPIGLVLGGLIFALVGRFHPYTHLERTARHCFTLAFVGVFPAILSGVLDWYHYHGALWIPAIRMKMILAAILIVLLLLAMLLHRKSTWPSAGRLAIYALCVVNVTAIGWYGGEIVFGSGHSHAEPHNQAAAPAGASYTEVQQILNGRCVICHAGSEAPSGLRLTSYPELMQGAENRAVVVAGKPLESELIRRIKGISTPQMPPNPPPLSASQISALERWVAQGAPGPQ